MNLSRTWSFPCKQLRRVGVPWHWRKMVDRDQSSDNVIDLLDCVLDKGIVIDASVRGAVGGIELLSVDARVVVASIGVYLAHVTEIRDLTRRSRAIASERRAIGAINSGGLKRRAGDLPLPADRSGPPRADRPGRASRRRPRRPAN